MVVTVRGDGKKFPPYYIMTEYKNASKASGRRPESGKTAVKGMNKQYMKAYIEFLASHVRKPSILLMDRHSSHKSKEVIEYIESFRCVGGEQKLQVKLFPPKSSFLISPCDMGVIAQHKSKFYKFERSTSGLKFFRSRK